MKSTEGDWTGKILGTNNADVFVEVMQSDQDLAGTARINDPMYGPAVYDYKGRFEDGRLSLEMDPSPHSPRQPQSHTVTVNGRRVAIQTDGVSLGHVSATGALVEAHRIEGKWMSSIGTGGTFWISRANSHVETSSKFEGSQIENSS